MKAEEVKQQTTNICSYSYEEYLQLVRSFHGHVAPE